MPALCWMDVFGSGAYSDVKIFRVNYNVLNRTLHVTEPAGYDLDFCAVVQYHLRDICAYYIAVAWLHHLVACREIGPELKSTHQAVGITIRHFLMYDPTAGGHPLQVTGGYYALVSHAVTMLYLSAEDISYGLYPAMRMPRESF